MVIVVTGRARTKATGNQAKYSRGDRQSGKHDTEITPCLLSRIHEKTTNKKGVTAKNVCCLFYSLYINKQSLSKYRGTP